MATIETLYENEYAEVTYSEPLDAVRIDWKRAASSGDYRDVLETGLEKVEEHGATNWIADLREMGTVAPQDQEWTNEEWFPRAMRTPLTQMAVVRSESYVQNMSVENIMQEVGNVLSNKYFDNVPAAENWLEA